jgi:uridine kinase
LGKPHIILIDGESGAGKSTLAETMAEPLGATVVRLDDVYTGWDGLVAGRESIISSVLRPLAKGVSGSYEAWDWELNQPGWHVPVPLCDVLIVEGCGISTAESRAIADVSIWLDCPEPTRAARLLRRDGHEFDDEMPFWNAQVARHIANDDPIATASVRLNG